MGNQAWTEVLEWPGAKKFQAATKKDFKVKSNGKVGGVFKTAEGLTFMRVGPLLRNEANKCRCMEPGICTLLELPC